ncbi:SIR2 family protein [Desulfosarcina ovata]|uniref:Uncharacterized protein n=1 Tax=Desulfosarcina ovata subsp. ovata TaxID=2752305 RepID=A0A5K8A432_9BACT|nr:SIR2 family protein [Desulfosarcina ovata]BBO87231.1 hypothetical protein DSCOOX_04110 [Desulfosarcina ovata subsp. ovata]
MGKTESIDDVEVLSDSGALIELKKSRRQIVFLLGAGASVSSGIPGAKQFVVEWLEHHYQVRTADEPDPPDISQWATADKLGIPDFFFPDAVQWYPKIFELRYKKDIAEGYLYLEDKMREKEPGPGYAALSQILSETDNKIVITTNFDNLVADALSIYSRGQQPLVIGHESLAGFLERRLRGFWLPRPFIAKVHRDLMLSPKNMPNEVNNLSEEWKESLKTIFSNCTPLVIGYGGNDGSLMNFLTEELTKINGGFYWCLHNDEKPSSRVKQVMNLHGGYYIRIKGFDEFMISLAVALLGDHFRIHSLAKDIRQRTEERIQTFWTQCNRLRSEYPETMPESMSQAFEYIAEKEAYITWREFIDGYNCPDELEAVYQNAIDDLEATCQKAKESFQELYEIKWDYARFLADHDDYEEAEILFDKALSADPDNSHNVGNYAKFMLIDRDAPKDAKNIFEKAVELDNEEGHFLAEMLLYLLLIEKRLNDDKNHWAGRLKFLLRKGFERFHLNLDPLFAYAKTNLSSSDASLICQIGCAIMNENKIESLEENEIWKWITPMS